MKLFFLLCILFTHYAYATFSTKELVDLVNSKNLKSIDEVIAHLPLDLRMNYTLQYKGSGLQEASYANPRAILFGKDAKFILTFNGSPTQTKYDSLEVLEFNNKTKEFEIYEVKIPSEGKIAYPEKNPANCMQCHATSTQSSPSPIWGRYPFWSGVYGSNDDQLYGHERAEYVKNAVDWKSHPRYKHLKDSPEGSFGPYSTVQLQTMSFRPNSNMGVLLARLNAKAIANQIKKVRNFEKYLLLASASFYHCKKQLTQETLTLLENSLSKDYADNNQAKAFPNKKLYDLENLSSFLGSSTYTWGQSSTESKITDPYFFDGFFRTTPDYVLAELADNFFAKFPNLSRHYKPDPLTKQTVSEPRLTRTQRDRDIVAAMDELGIPLKLNKSSCKEFNYYLHEEFSL
jgi:hypothetical protein